MYVHYEKRFSKVGYYSSPEHVDKYEKLGIIAEGSYGVVYKCRNKISGEMVAVKKFREFDLNDILLKKIARREVKLLKVKSWKRKKVLCARKSKYTYAKFTDKKVLSVCSVFSELTFFRHPRVKK